MNKNIIFKKTFTLIELVAVITILAIVTISASSYYGSIKKEAEDSVAKGVFAEASTAVQINFAKNRVRNISATSKMVTTGLRLRNHFSIFPEGWGHSSKYIFKEEATPGEGRRYYIKIEEKETINQAAVLRKSSQW